MWCNLDLAMGLFGTTLHKIQFRFVKFILKQFHIKVVTLLKREFGFHPAPALRMRNLDRKSVV